jgi:hypothetical protein
MPPSSHVPGTKLHRADWIANGIFVFNVPKVPSQLSRRYFLTFPQKYSMKVEFTNSMEPWQENAEVTSFFDDFLDV